MSSPLDLIYQPFQFYFLLKLTTMSLDLCQANQMNSYLPFKLQVYMLQKEQIFQKKIYLSQKETARLCGNLMERLLQFFQLSFQFPYFLCFYYSFSFQFSLFFPFSLIFESSYCILSVNIFIMFCFIYASTFYFSCFSIFYVKFFATFYLSQSSNLKLKSNLNFNCIICSNFNLSSYDNFYCCLIVNFIAFSNVYLIYFSYFCLISLSQLYFGLSSLLVFQVEYLDFAVQHKAFQENIIQGLKLRVLLSVLLSFLLQAQLIGIINIFFLTLSGVKNLVRQSMRNFIAQNIQLFNYGRNIQKYSLKCYNKVQIAKILSYHLFYLFNFKQNECLITMIAPNIIINYLYFYVIKINLNKSKFNKIKIIFLIIQLIQFLILYLYIQQLMNSKKLKWRTDFDKQVVIENFVNRGWTKCEKDDEDWNFYWATVWTVRNLFNPKTGIRLNDGQIVNHYPNHYELVRKDLMVKNLKRYKKQLEKNEHYLAKDQIWGGPNLHMDFFPMTFTFPNQYTIFLQQFQKNPNTTWIVKPNNKSQGQGIFLLKKINQLKKIVPGANLNAAFKNFNTNDTYVISRYIDNPMLIGGKKFDLRLYCLVTSYRPLKAWIFDQGFGRFCNELYSSDIAQLDNMFVHLTNVAIQKYSQKYSGDHGGKWSTKNLKFYLQTVYGSQKANKCFEQINNLIVMSLKSVQSVIINDKHCFQLYGFDVLLDSNCKPWLIEINSSPSLSTTTKKDLNLKMDLLRSLYEIVVPEDWGEDYNKTGTNTCTQTRVGGFSILYDETQQNSKKNIMNSTKRVNNNSKIWR